MDERTSGFPDTRALSELSRHSYVNFQGAATQTSSGSWQGGHSLPFDYTSMYNGATLLEQPQAFTNTTDFSSHWNNCS